MSIGLSPIDFSILHLLRPGCHRTIERALDEVIAEAERNRRTREAFERFAKSGIQIRDIYGVLED